MSLKSNRYIPGYTQNWYAGNPEGYQSPYTGVFGLDTLAELDQNLGDMMSSTNVAQQMQSGENVNFGIPTMMMSAADAINDIIYNTENSFSEDPVFDIAGRGTAADRHTINQLVGFLSTGNGLWGKSSFERELEEGINHANDIAYNLGNKFNNVKNNFNLKNSWNANEIPNLLSTEFNPDDGGRSAYVASEINPILQQGYNNYITGFYNQVSANNQRQLRNNMRNYFAEGGSLEELNGVTTFRGLKHGQFGLEGIPQGIASDGIINYVQGGGFDKKGNPLKGEIKYKDYIYGGLKITKKLAEKYHLPEKWIGLKYQEAADNAQQESKDRPNDPISLKSLDEWMTRLQGAQEEQKLVETTKEAAKTADGMSDEEKATLLSSLDQSMAQQEGIDLSQPIMYADGGSIHIKPSKRGTFTAAASKHGKSVQEFASQVLAHPENYSPAMRKKANFARNAAKWSHKHPDGGGLFPNGDFSNWNRLATTIALGIPQDTLRYIQLSDAGLLTNPLYRSLYNPRGVERLSNLDTNYPDLPFTMDRFKIADELNSAIDVAYTKTLPDVQIEAESLEPTIESSTESTTSTKNNTSTSRTRTAKTTSAPSNNNDFLRYIPVIGSEIGAFAAGITGPDYTYSNQLERLAGEYNPISAPALSGYRRYTPYDINLANAEAMAQQASLQRSNRATANRATQMANAIALENAYEKAAASRNLAWQEANEARRAAVDQYNLGIDQANANIIQNYDKINQDIRDRRIRMLQAAAAAQDASATAWSENVSNNVTNFFNQLGNLGKDQWSHNQLMAYVEEHPELLKFLLA